MPKPPTNPSKWIPGYGWKREADLTPEDLELREAYEAQRAAKLAAVKKPSGPKVKRQP